MNILTYTTLYPNICQPRHGIFVENRLRHLVASGEVKLTVIAPVPWFPSSKKIFGTYATFADVPIEEERYGIKIYHPRYLVIPKMGMNIAPQLMFYFTKKFVKSLLKKTGEIDLIDAHYFYPDGVAAIKLGSMLNKPVVITARGTDLSLIPNYAKPRLKILEAANKAAASVTVCQALKDKLIELGGDSKKIHVLRNGVDLDRFKPLDKKQLRQKLGLTGKTLLTVGHLVERKGHGIAIKALTELGEVSLLIAGDGEDEKVLRDLVSRLNLNGRVHFLGAIKQEELKEYYSAADALVLASSREGWANVLLESMACGTPVIATNIWGTPEVVAAPEAGVLMNERTPASLVEAYKQLMLNYPDSKKTRAYAEKFSWDETTQGQIALFQQIIKNA